MRGERKSSLEPKREERAKARIEWHKWKKELTLKKYPGKILGVKFESKSESETEERSSTSEYGVIPESREREENKS
ncbi:Hypothetical predicted protein [Olea europaea subsp. europaea]|uniref:Uncharacterized protein n=1 Tax=Olea europaea subsp. europaea TaxID=158383 RepID=A0A8S0R1D3_OLEEU|nr:Hypothetical predicted protein [Olea europaea subsp. europaea]